ncbi:hypothetical protein Droror1_Dr00018757 [Drosera rotundifolia]
MSLETASAAGISRRRNGGLWGGEKMSKVPTPTTGKINFLLDGSALSSQVQSQFQPTALQPALIFPTSFFPLSLPLAAATAAPPPSAGLLFLPSPSSPHSLSAITAAELEPGRHQIRHHRRPPAPQTSPPGSATTSTPKLPADTTPPQTPPPPHLLTVPAATSLSSYPSVPVSPQSSLPPAGPTHRTATIIIQIAISHRHPPLQKQKVIRFLSKNLVFGFWLTELVRFISISVFQENQIFFY